MSVSAETEALNFVLDELVARVESDIVPVERDVGALIRQVLERQLDFSTRKTLRKWQKAELEHRIAALVGDLVSMDLLDPVMHERLALRLAAAKGIQLDTDSALSIAEQLDNFLDHDHDPADFAEQWWNIPETQAVHGSATPACPDSSVFKRLFRQAAAALHPDKESDSDKLTEKHELMVQLLRAREERDLITLLRLHERYATVASGLSSADESQLEAILLEQLDVLQARREAMIHKSRLHFMAFQRFHDSDTAKVDYRIAFHIEKLERRKAPLCRFLSEVRTLKDLQELLSQPGCDHRAI